tara:strand:+ start:555 stop:899 length:345 start_codon:yes stop_codon:yes gene_type:complete
MNKIIYADEVHELVIGEYIDTINTLMKDTLDEDKFNNFADQLDRVIDYHNGVEKLDYYSWLMVLPLHTSLLASGVMIGIENDDNRADLRAIYMILDTCVNDVVEALNQITRVYE